MDLRRLRIGEYLTAAFGALLLASLFLPWYSAGGVDLTAWEAFTVVDLLLALSGLLGVGLLFLTASQRTAAVGVASDTLTLIAASVVALVAVLRLLDLPGAADQINASRALFSFVGTAAALGVPGGALLSMRDERPSRPGRPSDATGVPVEAPPEIETLPAPPRGASW